MSELEPTDAPSAPEPVPAPVVQDVGWALPGGASQPVGQGSLGYGVAPVAYAPAAAPVKRRFNRKRVLWSVTALVVVLALAAVGVVAFQRGRTGDSVVAVAHCQPTKLVTCLIKPPTGAVPLGGVGSWSQLTSPSAELYGSYMTNDAPTLTADTVPLLTTDLLHKIVHVDWNAVDGDNVDLVVLQFATQKGARAWNSTRAAEILSGYAGQSVAIPGDSAGEAHAAVKPDVKGNVEAAYSTVVGNLVLNVGYSSPKQFSAQDLETWSSTELASLRTAPPVPADVDPAVADPITEQHACVDRLTSCLAAMPSGAEHWQSPTSNKWVSASTLTASQYVQLFWSPSSSAAQTSVTSDFNTDGVTGIAHQDWDIDNAAEQADIYLVQTVTAAGASELSSSHFGQPDWSSGGLTAVYHKVPGEPTVQAWYTDKPESGGFIDAYFTKTVGNVIVAGWLYFQGSFDAGTADDWIRSQIDLVTRAQRTVPMAAFSLAAPALPAAHQGSCPASGDCLLPVPAGAVDTTASSFTASRILNASLYAAQYESADSAEVAIWLNSDGLKTAEHHAWSAGPVTADEALLKYDKPLSAKTAVTLEYGLNAASDRDCTDAAVPDSFCFAEPVGAADLWQNETVWVVAWKGDYEVSISVTRSNAADVADAYTWARQQLDLLPAS